MSKFNINIYEVIFSLSDALDLVGVDQIYHGKRVAYIAAECGKALNWDDDRLDDLFLAAILHDCDKGADLLQKRPMLARLENYVMYHHTPWTELLGLDLSEAVKFGANCIYMADRVDILALNGLESDPNILGSREQIRRKIKAKAGRWFHYDLVDIFLQISAPESFWLSMEQAQLSGYASSLIQHHSTQEIDFQELKK